ncbi:MAG: hypothetical protein R2753_13445 [Chitinophagales bacterium]
MQVYLKIYVVILLCLLYSCNVKLEENVLRSVTLVNLICSDPNLTVFCELINNTSDLNSDGIPDIVYLLEYSDTSFYDSITQQFCPSFVETVFAPSDLAFDSLFVKFPHWSSVTDIPQDTIDMIVKHHIYAGDADYYPYGAILYLEKDSLECLETLVFRGTSTPYLFIDSTTFVFASNDSLGSAILSITTSRFSLLNEPALISDNGIAYILDSYLGPF